MKTTLILVRHGETMKNVEGKMHQKGDGEILTDLGKTQIQKTADKLKKLRISKVFSSNEVRAIESSKIIASVCGVPSEIIEGMEERNWGIYANKSWSEVKAILDPLTFEKRYTYTPEDGESWKTFERRLINAINKLIENYINKVVVVITHGGAIRALVPYLLGVKKEESYKYDPKNASITIVEFEKGKITPLCVDNTDHL